MSRKTRRAANAREAGRKRRVRGKTAALALACAATMRLGAAHAQDAPAPGQDAVPLPELAYDTFFEPFTDNPVYRLHNPEPFAPVAPLFAKYDPLEGLTRPAKVSRVTDSGRGVVSFPVRSAKVGDKISVPVTFRDMGMVTAYVLRFHYDPAVLHATGVQKAAWSGASMDFNIHPDDTTPQRRVFIVQYSGDPWTPSGPPATISFDVVGAGDSDITVEHAEASDETFNNVPMVAHDGLIRVSE